MRWRWVLGSFVIAVVVVIVVTPLLPLLLAVDRAAAVVGGPCCWCCCFFVVLAAVVASWLLVSRLVVAAVGTMVDPIVLDNSYICATHVSQFQTTTPAPNPPPHGEKLGVPTIPFVICQPASQPLPLIAPLFFFFYSSVSV